MSPVDLVTEEGDRSVKLYPPTWHEDAELITRVSLALAHLRDEPPETIDTGLSNAVDLTAVDALFTGDDPDAGYLVLSAGDSTIQVCADRTLLIFHDGDAPPRN